MSKLKPDGYRLRMLCNQWFLRLERGGEILNHLGPYDYHTAQEEALKLDLPDKDRS